MIKANMGTISISGNKLVVKAELATIIKALSIHMDKADIMQAVNDGFKSDEELEKVKDKILTEILPKEDADIVKKLVKELLEGRM